jgi:hypothetical protein
VLPRRISISRLHLLVKPPINHQSDILLQRDMYRGWPRLQVPLIAILIDLVHSSIIPRPVTIGASNTTRGLRN